MDMKNTTYSYSEISNSIFKNIYTLFCGKQDCTPLYSFGPAIREYHLLHICTKGSGSFYANDYRYHIKKGQGFLIYPNELTFYQADEHTPWSYVWIAVSGEEVEKFLTLIGLSKQNPIFHCPDTERIASYIEDIMQHNTLSYSNEIYIEGVLMQLLSYLIESANTPYKEDQAVEKAVANATMEIPEAMIDTQVNQMAQDFAQRIQQQGLSMEQHFQFTGMTAESMMEELRPQAVKRIETRLVLEAIAKAENIEITDERIDEELAKMAEAYKMEVEKLKEFMGENEKEQMKMDLAVQDAVTFLVDNAVEE